MDDWALLNEVNVLPKLPAEFNEWLESKKWSERREALQALVNEVTKSPRLDPKADYFELMQNLRNILAKDANINVCAMAAKSITLLANGLRTKFAQFATLYIPIIFERFKERKPVLRDPLIECIDSIALTINLDTLADEVASCIEKPNPHIKQQACNFIYRVMKNYPQNGAPKKFIKASVPILVKFASDSDGDVREAACTALGSVMRLTGEKHMTTILGSLSEDKAKMKKITEARDQATVEYNKGEAEKKKECAPADSVAQGPAEAASPRIAESAPGVEPQTAEIDVWEMLDPVDVLTKLPTNFSEGIESKKWQERRDALQSLLTLCTENPRLCPKANYGEHVALLKKILEKDANINVCALSARCLTALATGLRKKFAPYTSSVVPVIFEKFKEKKPVLRDPLIDCIDAVSASTSLDALVDDIQSALDKQNPHIKIQTNLFLYRVFKRHNPQTAPKKILKQLAPAIVKLTGDPDPEVRDASYASLGAAMKAVGEKSCMVLLTSIADDKTKMSKIKDFCEKAIQEAGTDVVSIMVQSMHKSNPENATASGSGNSNTASPLKPPAPGVGNSNVGGKAPMKEVKEEAQEGKQSAPSQEENEFTKDVDEASKSKEELLVTNREKNVRLRDERNLKLLKWNFDQPNAEHVEQLRTLMSSVALSSLFTFLFSKDFKQQLKGIDILQSLAITNPESLLANNDLLLKWISLRFFETNPTVLLKVLDLTQTLFKLILQYEEPFTDQELMAFMPYLISKLGEQKDVVRTAVRTIIQLASEIVTPAKIFPIVQDGLKNKNARQRTECLQVLEQLLDASGMSATANPSQSLKQIASCIGDRDNNVRNAAINAVVVAWKEEGDRIFQMIGKMSDKDKAMLDERIKRSGATLRSRGGPERVANAAGRRGANIGVGVKGRGLRSDRSESRARGRQRSSSVSRDLSPDDGKENRTFIVHGQDGGDRADEEKTRKRFALDASLLRRDDDDATVAYPDVDLSKLELLQPIEPALRQRAQKSNMVDRAESVSSLTSLESLAGDVDKVVHSVASVSQSTATAAISQLQFLFGDPSNFRYVADRTDAVVQAIVAQTAIIRSRHLDDIGAMDTLNELVRTICHFLSSLVKEETTCSRISSEALKMLIQEFLYLLKDERMNQLKDISSICRSLNYLSIRICDNADPTECFLALCSMLTSALHDPRNKTVDLINKCIYKQSEHFVRETPMNFDEIVRAIHDFIHEFKPRSDENDLIKSSLHAMDICIQRLVAGTKGAIIHHVGLIRDPDTSDAVSYIKKCVRGLQSRSNQSSLANSAYGELPGQVPLASYEETVRRMLKQVAENPLGKGVRTLHTFLKMNPDARQVLDCELKKYPHQKDFINFHLKKMDGSERESPEVTDELFNVLSTIRAHREALQNYHQTGCWTSDAPMITATLNIEDSTRPAAARRSMQRSPADGAPENESTSPEKLKPKWTASDVEPLKQLLISRKNQQ